MAPRTELLTEASILLAAATRRTLGHLTDDQLLDTARLTETLGRLTDTLRTNVAGEIAERSRYELGTAGLAARHFHRTPNRLLEQVTRISPADAARRIRLAATTTPRHTLDGIPLPALHPHISAALTDGRIGVDAAAVIIAGLSQATRNNPTLHPDTVTAAEEALVITAQTEPVESVQDHVALWRDVLDPDGTAPRDTNTQTRRGFRMGREVNGITRSILDTAPKETALLKALFDEAANGTNPRFLPTEPDDDRMLDGLDPTDITVGPDGMVRTDDGATIDPARILTQDGDTRSREQRQHDVLFGLLTAGMRASEAETGGIRSTATVIAVTTLADINNGTGTGWLDGATDPISMASIEEMICEAGGVQNIILGNSGEVLYLGPIPRFFTDAQKRALMVRDGGCAAPGCREPARRCHAHHIIEWRENGTGGPTDIRNAVLLCDRHHHLLHASDYTIKMVNGKPFLLAPPGINPTHTWQPMGRTRAVMKPSPPDYR